MIFLIKHRWPLMLVLTLAGGWLAWALGAGQWLLAPGMSVWAQVGLGVGGALVALVINFILHEGLKRGLGARYERAFEVYGRVVLGTMRWPHYLAGGLMAALAEEPIFRGLLLMRFDHAVVGVAVAALVFAACHWLRPGFWPFWLWAMWEGVLFGILMVVTGSLLVPMVAHGIHDVAAYQAFAAILRGGKPRSTVGAASETR